jgi:hypothetical protein
MPADSTALGARPVYSRASSSKPNSRAGAHCHRNSASTPAANFCASARSSAGAGRSKLSSTVAAFTFVRRPCGLSTWNEAGACSRIEPTFSSPASS